MRYLLLFFFVLSLQAQRYSINSVNGPCLDGDTISRDTATNSFKCDTPSGGTVTSIATTAPISGGTITTTGTLSCISANTSTTGCVTSADWNTFNNKQPALGFTPENSANKNATNGYAGLSSGLLDAAQLPNPSASTLGGVKSLTCSGTDKISAIGTDGLPICTADQSSGVPAGTIILTTTSCAAGFSEVVALDGVTLVGTLAAHGDVGTTGGNDNITPTVNSLTAAAQTFTGSALGTHSHGVGTFDNAAASAGTPSGTNSTSTVTPLGTNGTSTAAAQVFTGTASTVVVNHVHVQNFPSSFTGSQAYMATDTSTTGSTASAISTANPTGGAANYTPVGTNGTSSVGAQTFTGSSSTVGAQTFTGDALATHDHAISGDSEAVSGGTPAGTNGTSAVTGTLNSFDNRSAFLKVIFCSKD